MSDIKQLGNVIALVERFIERVGFYDIKVAVIYKHDNGCYDFIIWHKESVKTLPKVGDRCNIGLDDRPNDGLDDATVLKVMDNKGADYNE